MCVRERDRERERDFKCDCYMCINTSDYKKIIMCLRNMANNGAIVFLLWFTAALFVIDQE